MTIPTLAATVDWAKAATFAAAVGVILWTIHAETPPRRMCWLVAAACAVVAGLQWTQPDHTKVGIYVLLGMAMAYLATKRPEEQATSEPDLKDSNDPDPVGPAS
ncbi:hypothetical protein [Streptomyces sp900116325]|uniref:Uncharacterized protein n=1 Tax=Streptomyces sp. 900116325 TaxID=3154295 RepID=A0ABV2UM93_9ACTN